MFHRKVCTWTHDYLSIDNKVLSCTVSKMSNSTLSL